jgi:hypothetical protein
MSTFENKEKNLNKLIDKLATLAPSYSQSTNEAGKLIAEKAQINLEKKEIEKKHQELLREHKYLNFKRKLKKNQS